MGPEDSFRKKNENAIKELHVILNYLKDFKDITDTLKKQRGKEGKQVIQVGETQKTTELGDWIRFETQTDAPRGERGSQNSGSQGNTRELSKSVQQSGQVGASAVGGGPSAEVS